jgi:hypothetical protein
LIIYNQFPAAATHDFEKATQIATTMVTRFGMGRDPDAADYGSSGRGVLSLIVPRSGSSLPTEVQPAATRAIRAILDTAYVDACETLAAHLDTLRRIAAYLVEEERVDGETFEELFEGRLTASAASGEWRPPTARPRDWSDVIPFRDRRFRRDGAGTVNDPVEISPDLRPTAIPSLVPLPGAAAAATGPAGQAVGEASRTPAPDAASASDIPPPA